MKTIFPVILCFLFISSASAQKPDTAIGKAVYDFTHLRDTNNRDKPFKETMALLLGRNASVYRSIDKQLREERLVEQIKSQIKNAQNPNSVDLTITGGGAVTAEEFYQFVNDKKFYTEENLINYYLVEEPLAVIDWKIQRDTLSLHGLHCQKAIAHFKGRDYEAWFCPDIPFRNGPWKLCGLPGLIIEAEDTKKEVIFKFAGFEDIRSLHQVIAPPADDIKTTPEKLERLKEASIKDLAGFSQAAHGSGVARRVNPLDDLIPPDHIHSINVKSDGNGNTRIINNPIELPEKK
jgi:GLPGLI family protein